MCVYYFQYYLFRFEKLIMKPGSKRSQIPKCIPSPNFFRCLLLLVSPILVELVPVQVCMPAPTDLRDRLDTRVILAVSLSSGRGGHQ